MDFGLTKKEAEVYLFLAKYEVLKGGEISKHTKIARSLVYRILKSLQTKGLVETTLESPIHFMAIPFEKTIDLIIRTKQEETLQVQRAKKNLLEDWREINRSKLAIKHEKFVIIENNKKIYSKIQQMINETKNNLSGILTLSTLARIEQHGIFETVKNKLKVDIKFQLVTNLNVQNIEKMKILIQKINSKINLKAKLDACKINTIQRFFLRDGEEILFFIRSEADTSIKKDEVCIYTNYASLVQTFKGIFQDHWNNAVEIEDGINKIEKNLPPERNSIKFERVTQEPIQILEKEKDHLSIKQEDRYKEIKLKYANRINLLTEEERDVLECASVIGQEFSITLIEKVTGFNRIRLLKKLNNIERKHNFIHSMGDVYRFSDSNIREILYEKIPANLRKEYHSLIAKKLEEIYKENIEEISAELAYHYYFSGNVQNGLPLLLKEAEKSWTPNISKNRVEDSIKYYSQIIELIGSNNELAEQKTNALEKLGDIHSIIMQHHKANTFYRKAIASTNNGAIIDKIRKKIQKKKTVEIKGMNLSYFVYGEGKQIVFFIGNSVLCMPQVHYFAQNCKVVVMDLPETLTQRTNTHEYSLESYLESMNVIIEDLKTNNIFLVGAALGGILAIHYVVKYPEKIKKLILIATPSKPAYVDQPERRKLIDKFWVEAFQSPSSGWKKFREIVWEAGPYSGVLRKTERKTGMYDHIRDQTIDPEMMLIYYKILLEADVRPIIETIKIPTLIIQGEKELHIVPLIDLKYLQNKISGSKLEIIKNAELITYTEVEKVNQLFEKFFTPSNIEGN